MNPSDNNKQSADEAKSGWVLPAAIPFEHLKRSDLEECIYWLLDAMGAKDLEWRVGGSGGGAPDGGRDLEVHFYASGADGEMESQKWWIECKGRKGTVEPDEVKSAMINAAGNVNVDCLVIATNTQFSNPTRDWVTQWQASHPRPKVKLWDHTHLERFLSKHPEVVLRLFSEALSLQGRFHAMESRFWNKIEYIAKQTLVKLWKSRAELELTELGLFAAVANEFAGGDITHRPWGAMLETRSVASVLMVALHNVPYLMMRSTRAGADHRPIYRAFAYLILVALDQLPAEAVTRLITESALAGKLSDAPEEVQEYLLMPIADQLLSEMQDVCSSDCRRISSMDRAALSEDKDEVATYWLRLEDDGVDEPAERRFLRLERHDAPCEVGFSVDRSNGCPLFALQPSVKNIDELCITIKRVAGFRKGQARAKREEEERRDAITKAALAIKKGAP